MNNSFLLRLAVFFLFAVSCGSAQNTDPVGEWNAISPAEAKYSSARLEVLRSWLKTQPTTAMMVIIHGRVLFQYGDISLNSKVASVRKSILSMLYGPYVTSGKIDLNKTVKELGLEDGQPFLSSEMASLFFRVKRMPC